MGRTLVTSPRVHAAIARMFPDRPIKTVLSRGNYAARTFLVVFADASKDSPGEMVTIPPLPKKRQAKP